MNNLIELVGGENRANDILKYQKEYFRNFTQYDVKKKVFAKQIDLNRPQDFIPVNRIESELRGSSNV